MNDINAWRKNKTQHLKTSTLSGVEAERYRHNETRFSLIHHASDAYNYVELKIKKIMPACMSTRGSCQQVLTLLLKGKENNDKRNTKIDFQLYIK